MHDCPDCGETCDCDSEDTWFDDYDDCEHVCEPDDDEYEKEETEYE